MLFAVKFAVKREFGTRKSLIKQLYSYIDVDRYRCLVA
jgi:hypothetical protein